MKVALVCPYDWSLYGGVKEHVQQLATHLQQENEVRIFAPASAEIADPRVVLIGKPRPIRFNESIASIAISPRTGGRLLEQLKAFSPDVTHVHEPLAPIVSATASALAHGSLVGTFHAWSHRQLAYRLAAPIARRVVQRLDLRIAVSPAAQQYAAAALRLPFAAFQVIPNGVDVSRFANAEPLPELLDPTRPLILFAGRLEPRKGVDVLVRAFIRLRVTRPHVRLCIVGEGPERARCETMIPPAMRPDVHFTGRVSQEQMPRYHSSADVFVSPAKGGESFGIVLLEAMVAGLPVVASNIPGYSSVMHDGREGYLVPPGDAIALTSTIERLIDNPHLRTAMSGAGREHASKYAWPVIGGRIEKIYSSLGDM